MDTLEKRRRGRPRAFQMPAEAGAAVQSLDRGLRMLADRRREGRAVAQRSRRRRADGAGDGLPHADDAGRPRHGRVRPGRRSSGRSGSAPIASASAFLRGRKLVDRARGGDAGADGGDRRDRQSRRRRGRWRGVRQPGRDPSGDPRLLPPGHPQPASTPPASARRSWRISRAERVRTLIVRSRAGGVHRHGLWPSRRRWRPTSPPAARAAGPSMTRSGFRGCAASPRRSSTNSPSRSAASRSPDRRCG